LSLDWNYQVVDRLLCVSEKLRSMSLLLLMGIRMMVLLLKLAMSGV
jgi:hypothetical protein